MFQKIDSNTSRLLSLKLEAIKAERTEHLLIILALVSIGLLFTWWFNQVINRGLRTILEIFDDINSGNYKSRDVTSLQSKDEVGTVITRLVDLQAKLKENIDSLQKQMKESSRVKQALDVATTNVMIADNNFDIIYMNESAVEMMQAAEADIKQEINNFDSNNLLGGSIDRFHKNPAHQRKVLNELTSTYKSKISVGRRTFNIISTPILDKNGERLGSVVEWDDQTEKLAKDKETQHLAAENSRVKQALDSVTSSVMIANNDLEIVYLNNSLDIMLRNAEDDIKKGLNNFDINKLVGTCIDVFHKNPSHQRNILKDLNSAFESQLTLGDRTMRIIVNPVFSDSGERLGSVVEWADRTQELAIEQEIDSVVTAAVNGDLTKRIEEKIKRVFLVI
ncbi:PAS domain-containing protein [Spartinivicinus ruber]|uniref:PAS domain-containing protein n=1 Tax=Spartinivicinus ruber TaxID=2683272 RepID=UPI0013CFAA9B|nr:PAS domain-containing protein [Spartinivicinus ruber]